MREYKYFVVEKTKTPRGSNNNLFINEISKKEYKKAESLSIYKTQASAPFKVYTKKHIYNGNIGWLKVAGKGFIFIIPTSEKFSYWCDIFGKIYFMSTKDYDISEVWHTDEEFISRALWTVYSRKNFNEKYLSQKNAIREDLIEKIKNLKYNINRIDNEYARVTSEYKKCRERVQNQHDELFGMLSDEERLLLEVKE